MAVTIRVTPQQLINTSREFEAASNNTRNLTRNMLNLINSTYSWTGDASTAYKKKFKGLEDDMDLMYRKVREHSTDLVEIARNYTGAEDVNIDAANTLNENPII